MLKDLDFRMEQLSGSTPTRVDNAEKVLAKLETFQGPGESSANIRQSIATAHLRLGILLGHPFQLHLNQFERSRNHLLEAQRLFSEILQTQPSNFSAGARVNDAERVLAAQAAYIHDDPETALRMITNGINRVKNLPRSTIRDNHRLAVQYAAQGHLKVNLGRMTEASTSYAAAEALLDSTDDATETEYQQTLNQRTQNFFLDEKATFALAKKEYDRAGIAFTEILNRHKNSSSWRDQRRASRAQVALACIGIVTGKSLPPAIERIQQAEIIIRKLKNQYPSTISLSWELARYQQLPTLLSLSESESSSARQQWSSAFRCNNAYWIMDPPRPHSVASKD